MLHECRMSDRDKRGKLAMLRDSSFAERAKTVGLVIMAAVPLYFIALGLLGVRLRDLKRQSVAESHD